jgi:multiple sugar transport system substrate-binding protein
MVRVPGMYVDDASKLITAVRGGTAPDIFEISRPGIAQRAADGLLEDITFCVQQEPDLASKYLEFSWKDSQWRGKQYGLPFNTDNRALFYNKDLLKAAGVDMTVLDPKNGPITLQQLADIAAKLDKQDANGNYSQLGFVAGYNQGGWPTWFSIFGLPASAPYNDAKCDLDTTNPTAVATYQFLYDWYKRYGPQKLASFISTYDRPDSPPAERPFYAGRIATFISGPWELANIAKYNPKLNYGVTYLPVPKAGDKPRNFAAGWGMTIPKGTKHPEEACKFLRYLTGEEGQRVQIKVTQNVPTWKPLLEDKSLYQGDLLFFMEQAPMAVSLPVLPVGAQYFTELAAAQQKVQLNEADAATALKTVYDRIQPQLQPYCPK